METNILNVVSMASSVLAIYYINKHTARFGPFVTLSLLFASFFVINGLHAFDYFYFLHRHHDVFIALFQFVILFVYAYEIKKVKYEGNWMPSDILNNLPDMLWVKDSKSRFIYVNDKICKDLLLCTKIEAMGKTGTEIAQKNVESGVEYTFGEVCNDSDEIVLSTNKADTFLEIGKVNGQFLSLQVVKAPIHNRKGKIIGTIGIGRDLTYDMLDHVKLEQLYKEGNFKDLEKLFEAHKFRHLIKNKNDINCCLDVSVHNRS